MKEQFLQKIFSYIEEQELIGAGDVVFAGVSGGADSMCLLEVLCAYRCEVDFELRVIHVEHGLRGEASLADAAFVTRFCEERAIPCEVCSVDAGAYSKAHGFSIEEAARILRYEAFEAAAQIAENTQTQKDAVMTEGKTTDPLLEKCVRIAVAHHMEDQAETVLWQLIRGSDVKGLGGMRPRRGRIIRPLLVAERTQIEAFLREKGICWREDVTNKDGSYTRNRLRMEVIPVLMHLNGQAVSHICESAGRLQEAENYLADQTQLMFERYTEGSRPGRLLVRRELLQEPPFMRRRVCYRALETVCGSAKDLGAKHVSLLEALFSHQVGRELAFPYSVMATRVYEGVELLALCAQCADQSVENILPEQVQMEVLEDVSAMEISKKKYTKWFDYDKIEYNVQIRKRQNGDYLVIDGDGHRQLLKRYLVNEKIPKEEREGLLVLADGSHVMWVIGHRISEYYKVDAHTKRVLKVQYHGGKEDE